MSTHEPVRLNRWFSAQGICSRREADRRIEAGRVTVNGEPAELGTLVGPGDTVALDGRPLEPRQITPVVLLYNKPVGVECTLDPSSPNNLVNAIRYPERVVHVGRLDIMSEGLLLLTNIGDLVDPLLRKSEGHARQYRVALSEPISDQAIEALRRGVPIGDDQRLTLPCEVVRLGPELIQITLTEGRNRQVRRMAEAVGNHVRRLERERFGMITLGDLPRGAWRHLSRDEIIELCRSAGVPTPQGLPASVDTRPQGAPQSLYPTPQDRGPRHRREHPRDRDHRPARRHGDRPERGRYDNRADRRPERGYDNRADRRPERGYDDRPERSRYDNRPERGYDNRPERGYDNRPERGYGQRPERGRYDNRPERGYDDRADRRPERGYDNRADRRPERGHDDRPERGRYDNRPERGYDDRADRRPERGHDDRPPRGRFDNQPGRDRFDDRPRDDRQRDDRPHGRPRDRRRR